MAKNEADRDGVIEKVRKLLALAKRNNNPNEAQNAAVFAQKLMAEHAIKQKEVGNLDEDQSEVVNLIADEMGRKIVWKSVLLRSLAENFRCYCYSQRTNRKRGRMFCFCVMGSPADVRFVIEMYKELVEVGDYFVNAHIEARRLGGDRAHGNFIRDEWLRGFCLGIQMKLEGKIETHPGYALLLVRSDALVEAIDNLKTWPMKVPPKTRRDEVAYSSGYIVGYGREVLAPRIRGTDCG